MTFTATATGSEDLLKSQLGTTDNVNPAEIGRAAWKKYSEDFHRQMRRQYGRDSS
jgi:hypothetical protein